MPANVGAPQGIEPPCGRQIGRGHGPLLQNLAGFSDTSVLKSVLEWSSIRSGLPRHADSSKIVHIFCTTAQAKHGYEKRQH